jgi:DNA-binding transcriptional ArsR family regulator
MDFKKQAKIFKALSNPNRLEIFIEIMEKCESCYPAKSECYIVDEIMNSLKIGAPTVSHHLKELKNAGLIETERQGKYLVAKVNEAVLEEARNILKLTSRNG